MGQQGYGAIELLQAFLNVCENSVMHLPRNQRSKIGIRDKIFEIRFGSTLDAGVIDVAETVPGE